MEEDFLRHQSVANMADYNEGPLDMMSLRGGAALNGRIKVVCTPN